MSEPAKMQQVLLKVGDIYQIMEAPKHPKQMPAILDNYLQADVDDGTVLVSNVHEIINGWHINQQTGLLEPDEELDYDTANNLRSYPMNDTTRNDIADNLEQMDNEESDNIENVVVNSDTALKRATNMLMINNTPMLTQKAAAMTENAVTATNQSSIAVPPTTQQPIDTTPAPMETPGDTTAKAISNPVKSKSTLAGTPIKKPPKGDKKSMTWAEEMEMVSIYDHSSMLETKIILEEVERVLQETATIKGNRDFINTVKINKVILEGMFGDLMRLIPNIPDSLVREVIIIGTKMRRVIVTQDPLVNECEIQQKVNDLQQQPAENLAALQRLKVFNKYGAGIIAFVKHISALQGKFSRANTELMKVKKALEKDLHDWSKIRQSIEEESGLRFQEFVKEFCLDYQFLDPVMSGMPMGSSTAQADNGKSSTATATAATRSHPALAHERSSVDAIPAPATMKRKSILPLIKIALNNNDGAGKRLF